MTRMTIRPWRQERIVGVLTACLLVISLLVPRAFSQDTDTLDVQSTLRLILDTLKKQQAQIDELRAAIERQAETIHAQQKMIQRQEEDLSTQRQQIDKAAAGGGLDAAVQYKVAMELQHVAIFDIRRREQPAYFRRCIEEFRKIVTEWPASSQAAAAQYRIGKILHRYLKEYDKAIREYEALLQNYPDSEFAPEGRDALHDLRGR